MLILIQKKQELTKSKDTPIFIFIKKLNLHAKNSINYSFICNYLRNIIFSLREKKIKKTTRFYIV